MVSSEYLCWVFQYNVLFQLLHGDNKFRFDDDSSFILNLTKTVSFFHQLFFFDDTLTNNNILFVVIAIIFEPSNYLQDLMLNILSYTRFND